MGPYDRLTKGKGGRWAQRKPDRETRRVKPSEAKKTAPKEEEPRAEKPSTATSQAEYQLTKSFTITDSDGEAESDAVQSFLDIDAINYVFYDSEQELMPRDELFQISASAARTPTR